MKQIGSAEKNDGTAIAASKHLNAASRSHVIVELAKETGHFLLENIALRPGLRMVIFNHAMPGNFRMSYEIEHAPLGFSFNLSQKIRLTLNCDGRRRVVERSPGDALVAYLPNTRGVVESPGGPVVGVSLYFTPHAFRDLFRETPECLKDLGINSGQALPKKGFFHQNAFNGDMSLVLRQIIECPYRGELRRLFLEAKALELVALRLWKSGKGTEKNASALNRRELDRIREVRHTLLARLDDPPSLTALSRLAGINRNKLNQGFKQLYGKTAFHFLRDARLSKARTLLQQTDLTLSEVAFSVGYNNQANLTKAFRAHFGQTPKTVRRQGMGANMALGETEPRPCRSFCSKG